MIYDASKIEYRDVEEHNLYYKHKVVLYNRDKIFFNLSFFLNSDDTGNGFTEEKFDKAVSQVVKDNIYREFFIIDNSEPIFPYLENIKKFLNLCEQYKKNVTIITGQNSTDVIDLYKHLGLNVIFLPLFNFISYSKNNTYSPFYKTNTLEKKYLTLNRANKEFRQLLYDYLKDNDLLKFGEYSFGFKNDYSFDENIEKSHRNNYMCSIVDSLSFNKRCFLNFVIETENRDYIVVNDKKITTNFVSEKTYKALLTGLPFIIIGEPNTLRSLKQYGIKTFENYWNEDYDSYLNGSDRFQKSIDILTNICYERKSILRKIYNDVEFIHKHNVKLIDDIVHDNLKILKEKINL
jgi:hypothetical protein